MVTMRDLRHMRGLSLAALVDRMSRDGVRLSVAAMSRYETGQRHPNRTATVRAWARVLRVPPQDVIFPHMVKAPVVETTGALGDPAKDHHLDEREDTIQP